MSIVLRETSDSFGYTDPDFLTKINDENTRRMVAKLLGEAKEEAYEWPIMRRNDEDGDSNHRLTMIHGFMMGELNLDYKEVRASPLLGLYDHKGILTSVWQSPIDLKYIEAIHHGWERWYEDAHYVVSFGGLDELDSQTFVVGYETTD
jgi:hypothetical protein